MDQTGPRERRRRPGCTTIHRSAHDEAHPYVQVSNAVAQDSRLTFEARGVMLYLLSKPNNWHIQKEDLMRFSDQEDESNPWDDDPHSYETVEKYVNYCLHYLGHDIRNPPGLVKTILKERNPRDYYAIETRLADREMELQAEQERREQQEADRLQRAREEEELQQREEAQRNENERLRAEENERRRLREITEAPAREAQRLNQEKRDRQARIEECETAIKTWSSQTAIETFINAKLSPGEKADLQNRLTSRAASGR